MSQMIDPNQVKFIVDNDDGTSTARLKNGEDVVLLPKQARAMADVLNNEKRRRGEIQAFNSDSLRALNRAIRKNFRLE